MTTTISAPAHVTRQPTPEPRSTAAVHLLASTAPFRYDIGIVGLGYVGLPTALAFHAAGRRVLGIDASPARLADIQAGYVDLLASDHDRLRSALEARPAASSWPSTPSACGRPDRHRLRADAGRRAPGPRPHDPASRLRVGRRARRARPDADPHLDHLRRHAPGSCSSARSPSAAWWPGGTSLWRSAPSASTRATTGTPRRDVPRVVGGVTPELPAARRRGPGAVREPRAPGQLAEAGRDDQAAGEHLPRGEHRAGQRDGRDRRALDLDIIEVDRRRVDQAVRLHAVLPGPRRRRPLHPVRPALPALAAARESGWTHRSSSRRWRHRRAVRGGSSSDAGSCSPTSGHASGGRARRRRRRLQAGRRGRPGVAGPRDHRRAAGAGRARRLPRSAGSELELPGPADP